MRGVSKRFGPTVALTRVGIAVRPGEVHALVGENGAGKSTLVKILSGAYQADEGEMWLDGRPYRPKNPLDGRRAGVAMIYQELSLAPQMSIAENILLGVEPTRGPFLRRDEVESRARRAMEMLGLEHHRTDTVVSRLAVAEQQLVELARAVAIGSRVLVLDEPTSTLTREDIGRLFRLIGRLKEKGYAIVYISHFLEEVKEVSDRFTVLRDGEVVGGGSTGSVHVSDLAAMMVGRELEDLYAHSDRSAGETVLEVSRLRGDPYPLSASFQLRRGEVLGLAGLVGAGRTELLRTIFGLAPVRSGKIKVIAYVGPASPAARWAQGVGIISEDRKEEGLALNLSIADNITLTNLKGLGPARLVMPSIQNRKAAHWIERLSVKCLSPEQRLSELSGGNQQKVALARLLYHDVDVLLLDEPTRGIDVGSKAEIYRLIDQLAIGSGEPGSKPKAVLMVSSYLPELIGICDRIAVMCRGRLSEARPAESLSEHEIMVIATGSGEL